MSSLKDNRCLSSACHLLAQASCSRQIRGCTVDRIAENEQNAAAEEEKLLIQFVSLAFHCTGHARMQQNPSNISNLHCGLCCGPCCVAYHLHLREGCSKHLCPAFIYTEKHLCSQLMLVLASLAVFEDSQMSLMLLCKQQPACGSLLRCSDLLLVIHEGHIGTTQSRPQSSLEPALTINGRADTTPLSIVARPNVRARKSTVHSKPCSKLLGPPLRERSHDQTEIRLHTGRLRQK